MNELAKKYLESRVIPQPRQIQAGNDEPFQLTDGCRVVLETAMTQEESLAILQDTFRKNWNIRPDFSIRTTGTECSPDAYTLETTKESCLISASNRIGLLNALKSLRQLSESERGVLTTSRRQVPCVKIEDSPRLAFRGIHFCWFPETPVWEIEKEIRLAAYYKFNYAVIESWGMIRLDSHPEFCWNEFAVGKEEVARLVRLASELGLRLIPQVNLFGHATVSRCGSGKHMLLDQHPEYASLFEPDGWTWCISNPHTRKYLEEMVLELHELFGNPSYFHIGCDEAYNAGSCSLCAENYPEKLRNHLLYFHDLLAKRGARVMMWHDMLLCRDDPRWDGYIVCGHSKEGLRDLYRELPKDIILCDWQYGYPEKDGKEPDWPTSKFFKQNGFDVLVCPWLESKGTASLGKCAAEEKLFGVLETTWHWCRGSHRMDALFIAGSNAAWNPEAKRPDTVLREYMNRHLREMAQDMHLKNYVQFGSVQYQINPTPYQD